MSVKKLYKAAEIEGVLSDPETAHIILDKDKILGMNDVPGLKVNANSIEDGVDIRILLKEGIVVEKPVHLCFGVTDREAIQRIILDIEIEDNSEISILAHCVFPSASDVKHIMNADIRIGENAKYTYLEKHIHSLEGGVEVVPKARVKLSENARFKSDFELIKGRVGEIDIDYKIECEKNSVMEMTAKVDGRGDDVIRISEAGNLIGEGARGVLTTRVALRDKASAEVYNELIANAPEARGHVDCKEIVQDKGSAKAIPVVEVNHPKAHVTHEAAIGSVDTKQLETLMSRGLSEEESVDIIIEGLLS